MVKETIIATTMLLGFFEYIILLNKSKKQAEDHKKLPTVSMVREKIDESFTGYILCLDYVRYAKSSTCVQSIHQWMNQHHYPFFVFDGPTVIPDAIELGEKLGIEYLPSLIAVKKGRSLAKGLHVIPGKSDMMSRVEAYVVHTRETLFVESIEDVSELGKG